LTAGAKEAVAVSHGKYFGGVFQTGWLPQAVQRSITLRDRGVTFLYSALRLLPVFRRIAGSVQDQFLLQWQRKTFG